MLFDNKTAAVIGIGISNTPLIKYLLSRGASVTARDRKPESEIAAAPSLKALGVKLICGDDYLDGLDEDVIFRTPGLRYDTPQLVRASERGAVITSEMELFFEECPAKKIAVTGSDGKTTTTTLISLMIKEQTGRVFVGGNIGEPLIGHIDEITKDDICVLELSSFQLHTMKRSPDIAVITNLSPNHLDYHHGMEEYADAKKNIFRYQKPGDRLVLNYGNDYTRAMACEAADGVDIRFFASQDGVYEKDGVIFCGGDEIINTADILIPGHHNVENYMAAIGAVYPFVSREVISHIARTFGGVEHRLELVCEKNGIKFYNSSIDSSPTRTAAALSAFGGKTPLTVICGGYDKHIPFAPLAEALIRDAQNVVLTGATAKKIKEALDICAAGGAVLPEIAEVPDFRDAVLQAARMARPGEAVVLSPACASFDAFPNFMVRGDTYREIVRSI